MSGGEAAPIPDGAARTAELEAEARALAALQGELERAPRLLTRFFAPPPLSRPLERARALLGLRRAGSGPLPAAAAWFLDNFHLIRRVARQVEDELPRGFVRHLPRLAAGASRGLPRVDALARAFVDGSALVFGVATLRRFVLAYQELAPLTIAELWALPTMLRAAVLGHLLQALVELGVELPADDRRGLRREPVALPPGDGVERAIRALRVLEALDWQRFFEQTSRVEAILRTDPAHMYERMEFATCDSYRKVVEALAWSTGTPEPDVAELTVALARAEAPDERRGHVGHWLVGEGRPQLEQRLGHRPFGLERVRRAVLRWPTVAFLLPVALGTAAPVGALLSALAAAAPVVDAWLLARLAVLAPVLAVPLSATVVSLVQLAFARLLPPRTLPKLDLSAGLPAELRTLVVMPTLLGRSEDVAAMTRQLELHYLSNPDPQLRFALLTDDLDAEEEPVAQDAGPLLQSAAAAIERLNATHGEGGVGPFHLLHRAPRWNPGERRYMGWERKRGKLEELNRLLRGDAATSYTTHVGAPEGLQGIRYVITLDADTQLPMGAAHRLVGLLAHPLNRAVFEPVGGRVLAGYTIVQPCIATSPTSAGRTLFARIFAGDVGFDIYTHASSELYQDLFGAGIYVGKGIYDVDAFTRSLHDRAPENALVSHDLFEGVHGRTALASDIVLFEEFPSRYATWALRMHRWVRGDWQLLPWLLPRVPSVGGALLKNRLTLIDRWKIADNLRRSLVGAALLLLLVLGWSCLPGPPLAWTAAALGLLLGPALPGLLLGRRERLVQLARVGLQAVFLAYESAVVADAVTRVLVRRWITRRLLLQWTSAAHTAFAQEARGARTTSWRTMAVSPLFALLCATLALAVRPEALLPAAPLLLAWALAPELARWLGRPARESEAPLAPAERLKLRRLARRTWRFFDAFVGPNDQWLPIDNYQEAPREQTAHRTSPTNIGLMLLSTLSAWDAGYLGPVELSLRVRRAFDSIARLPHYQGHLLNWYDTKNLRPLLPRYVSTVDSGNFAGCLVALAQGCREVSEAPVVRAEDWEGLQDSIGLLEEVVEAAPAGTIGALRVVIARMQAAAAQGAGALEEAQANLRVLSEELVPALDRELLLFLESGAHRHEADLLHTLRTAIGGLHQQLERMRGEQAALLPWLSLAAEAASLGVTLPKAARLHEIPAAAAALRAALQGADPSAPATAKLHEAIGRAERAAESLVLELRALAKLADDEVAGMDFALLYDRERRLFHIGFNATIDQVDPHHYDLLASEARLASYVAIVKRDVPSTHWYALGRQMTRVGGAPALLSWGGTMFEYLMPGLLMRSQPGTLLARSCALAVQAQIEYGRALGQPWGISESAWARVDAEQTWQYRAFGVPGLGFKRGLEADRVVTPYASLLAVSLRPRAVVQNLRELERRGMVGTYGLYEALDLTKDRAPLPAATGAEGTIVRSWMAHHQGMIFVALGNFLHRRSMVDRFHADARIETGALLLNEHAPEAPPPEWPVADASPPAELPEGEPLPRAPDPWPAERRAGVQLYPLGNGRLTSVLTGAGGGGLRWQGLALTRFVADPTRDDDGLWLWLRDEESGRLWRATSRDGRTTFAMHKADFHLREHGVSARVDVTVAAADDVEVRLLTLHNETSRPRSLVVTSAARPVLFDAERAASHPAFASLFLESERVAELDGLLFTRRPQGPQEPPVVLVHRLVRAGAAVVFAGVQSDRGAFFGRGATERAPAALSGQRAVLEGTVGAMLDPLLSVSARVELPPKGSATLAFVTAVGRSRSVALALARKYGSMHAVRWSFRDAEQEAPRRLLRTRLDPALLPAVQRLWSALQGAPPGLRAPLDQRQAAQVSQHRLWGKGISGDDPLLVVRVHDPAAPLLRELLAAQRWLRDCGLRFELVLLDAGASGYLSEGPGTLRGALVDDAAAEWLDRRGGVFLVARDQLAPAELLHLEASARVLLDTREGSLAARLDRVVDRPPLLPKFEPTLAVEADERPRPLPPLLLQNGHGGFTEDGREYVIEAGGARPTPAPWCNVLANPTFGTIVSESSFGATWSLNAGENRLTPWRNDPVHDTPSEALYLRDEESAAVWTTTPLPAGGEGTALVRHGAGYTTWERESHGLLQELTVFVPHDAPLKIVKLRLTNRRARHRRLTATYYAEWVLGRQREAQRPFVLSEFDEARACLLATTSWSAEFAGRVAFLATREQAHGFTADRTEFLGRRGDYARPEALERWGLSGRVDLGADPCGALQVHLELAPFASIETHFVLGQAATREEALALAGRWRDGAAIEEAGRALTSHWDGLLGAVRVRTPEPSMDLLLNRWLLYQTLAARLFGRTGLYQSSGAFGFRDQLQDVLALLHAAPELARAHLLEAARHQFEEGDVLHWWHPPSGRGVRTRCSDDLAWLPYVLAAYVEATGDAAVLEVRTPFLGGEPLAPGEHDRYATWPRGEQRETLFEHARLALERAVTTGVHGLPLMGGGDWNDGMDRVGAEGRGESVWLGWFLCSTLERFAGLTDRRGDGAAATALRARAGALREAIEAVAWDGDWYLRAFHDDGSLVGSSRSRECRIDSIAQSWAALAKEGGDAWPARTSSALRAVEQQLVREEERLVRLFWPPFDGTAHDPGYVRAYPPGVRENGGQYTHAAVWLGFAHARLGDGAAAERIFRLLNPALRARTPEEVARYRVEPYVLAGDVYGCAPWVGRGGWSWYTGSAPWLWRLGVEELLGLRREEGKLRVSPCLPPAWPGFEAWVRLGGAELHVIVENPERVSRGVVSVTLDGVARPSALVDPAALVGARHELLVRLGAGGAREEELSAPGA